MEVLSLEKEIVSEFEIFDNWMEKYEYLIELGKDSVVLEVHGGTKIKVLKSAISMNGDVDLSNKK